MNKNADAYDRILDTPVNVLNDDDEALLPKAVAYMDKQREVLAGPGMRPVGLHFNVAPDLHLASTSLPKDYKYHREMGGEFRPDGSCIFESWAQLRRTVKHANANGEEITFGGRGEMFPD